MVVLVPLVAFVVVFVVKLSVLQLVAEHSCWKGYALFEW